MAEALVIAQHLGGSIEPDDEVGGPRLVVLALDPGITTGWSAMAVPTLLLAGVGVGRAVSRCDWRHGELVRGASAFSGYNSEGMSDSSHVDKILDKGREVWADFVDEERGDKLIWVIEGFSLRMMSMDPNLLAPVRVRSAFFDRVRDASLTIFSQTPSDAKTTVTDARLKRMGLYDPGSGAHARDADRHLVLFLRRWMSNQDVRKRSGLYLPSSSSGVAL